MCIRDRILIYHTHSQETFADSRPGERADTVIGLGDDLQELLEKQYGYEVLHITEAFDMKEGCLERSRAYNLSLIHICQQESAYHLYCLDKTGTTLVQEPYEPKEGTDQKLIKELVDALQEKPAKDGNQALLSNGISIKTYTLENGLLTLNLSGEYGELARPQEVLVRAGLVRTFVQVPEVEDVYKRQPTTWFP